MADPILAASDVSGLQTDTKKKEEEQRAESEIVFAREAAKALTQTSPDLVEAITRGASNLSGPEAIAGSSLPGAGKALIAALGGLGKGFVEEHAKQADRQALIDKKTAEFQDALQKKISPIIQDYSKNTDVADEKTRADAIGQIKDLLNSSDAKTNDKLKAAIVMLLPQAIRPEYKRLNNENMSDLSSIKGVLGEIFKEGIGTSWDKAVTAAQIGDVLINDDTVELKTIIDSLDKLSKEKFALAAEPYVNLMSEVGLGGMTDKFLKAPKGYSVYGVATPAVSTTENKLIEGQSGTGSDGKKYKVVGGVWVLQ
jgi:hypothetical protein